MASSGLWFMNCATFLDVNAAVAIDEEEALAVQGVVDNLRTYHMEYDANCPSEKLPRCFYRDFGDLIYEYIVLRDPQQNEIEVQFVKRSNELYFGRGWSRIKDVYNLWFGGWVDFVYVNPKLLNISLRTRSGGQVIYPVHDPPLKYMLPRTGDQINRPLSSFLSSSHGCVMPRSFVRCYLKALTAYDVQTGILVLPWYRFGQSAFAFTFKEIVLVDHSGCRYPCHIDFSVDCDGELACKVWGGWSDLCRKHQLAEGDRVRFAVTGPQRHYVLYVCVYPQIGIETTLSYPLKDGTYLPLYISQQYFVANC